jgi:hypothetical protein
MRGSHAKPLSAFARCPPKCSHLHHKTQHSLLPSAPTEEEELNLLNTLLHEVPQGDCSPTSFPPNTELAHLRALLHSDVMPPSSPTKPPSQTISSRFPLEHNMPQGFSLSLAHNPTTSTSTHSFPTAGPSGTSPPPSNPFGATPLLVPEDFSPSKVQDATAPPLKNGKTKKEKLKIQASGTRQSSRPKKDQPSYKEMDEFVDDIDA